jgi:hypothetical protein
MSHRLQPRGGAKNDQPELIAEADDVEHRMNKIERKGDWGSYNAVLEGKELTDGELVIVRWPDGRLDQIAVTVRTENGSVSDHGKEYTTYSKVAYYVTDHRGIKIDVPLHGLEAQRV